MSPDSQKQRLALDSRRTLATQALFELDEVFLGAVFSIHDWVGVVLPDYAFGIRLHGRWGKVWFINVFGWQMLEFGNPRFDELSEFRLHVEAGFGIRTGVVQPEVRHGKGSYSRKPKPIPVIERPIGVDQFLVEDVPPEPPILPELSTG